MPAKRRISIDENQLIAQLQQRDERSFSIFYRNYATVLRNAIQRIVKSEEVAADLLQEVFVKIWLNLNQYNPAKGSLYTWAVNVAQHAALDKLRSKEHKDSQRNFPIADLLPTIDTVKKVEFSTDGIGVQSLVGQLKPIHRQVVDLFYFQGYSQAEIAQELNIPVGSTKTHLRKAIFALRTFF